MRRFDPKEFEVLKQKVVGENELTRDSSVIDWEDDFSKIIPMLTSRVTMGPLDIEFGCDVTDEYLNNKGFISDCKLNISNRNLAICKSVANEFSCNDQCEYDEMLSIGVIALCERGDVSLTQDLKKKTVRAAIRDFRAKGSSILSFPVNRKTVDVISRGCVSIESLLSDDNQWALLNSQVDMVPYHRVSHRLPCQSEGSSLSSVLKAIQQLVGEEKYNILLRYYGGGSVDRSNLASELGMKVDSLAKKISRMTRKLSGDVRYLSCT